MDIDRLLRLIGQSCAVWYERNDRVVQVSTRQPDDEDDSFLEVELEDGVTNSHELIFRVRDNMVVPYDGTKFTLRSKCENEFLFSLLGKMNLENLA